MGQLSKVEPSITGAFTLWTALNSLRNMMKLWTVKVQMRKLIRKLKKENILRTLFKRIWIGYVLLKNNVNIDVNSECQTWQQIFYLGSKSVKSGVQPTIGSKSVKLDVHNSNQIVHTYTVDTHPPSMCSYTALLITPNLYPNNDCNQGVQLLENLEIIEANFQRLSAKN